VSAIRVLLADDHAILRSGLRLLLEREAGLIVAAEASDGCEAVTHMENEAADVVVMDVGMPGLNGVEAATRILRKRPRAGIVMLSMHGDETYVLRCLRAGARAYVLKESAEGELIAAIRAVAAGRTFFSPKVARLLQQDHVERMRRDGAVDTFDLLTAREREILQLIGEGNANKEIAARLSLSLYTVETHRGNILEKLGLHSTADIILYAVRKGIVR
jgi:two-component system, NarL family, response regulator NreC